MKFVIIAMTLFEIFIAAFILKLIIIIIIIIIIININIDVVTIVFIIISERFIIKLIAFGFDLKKRLIINASFNKS